MCGGRADSCCGWALLACWPQARRNGLLKQVDGDSDEPCTCSLAGTVKVKSSNIQVGDLIIVEKVSDGSSRLATCVRKCGVLPPQPGAEHGWTSWLMTLGLGKEVSFPGDTEKAFYPTWMCAG